MRPTEDYIKRSYKSEIQQLDRKMAKNMNRKLIEEEMQMANKLTTNHRKCNGNKKIRHLLI